MKPNNLFNFLLQLKTQSYLEDIKMLLNIKIKKGYGRHNYHQVIYFLIKIVILKLYKYQNKFYNLKI